MAFDDKNTQPQDQSREVRNPEPDRPDLEQKSGDQEKPHQYSDWASI